MVRSTAGASRTMGRSSFEMGAVRPPQDEADYALDCLVLLRLEADYHLAAWQLQHRTLDHRGLRQHQRDRLLFGDAFLVLVGQFLEGGAAAVEQRFPADLLRPAFQFFAR